MLFPKLKRTESLIGIEINSRNIKLLELAMTGRTHKLCNYVIAPTPANAVIYNNIRDQLAVGTIISDTLKQISTQTKQAAVAVAGSLIMSKKISMNAGLNTADMEAQAWIEATKLFPNLVEDISLDFTVLGQDPLSPNQVEVLLVACRKEQVQTRVNVLEEAGLTPKVIDVDFYALQRVLGLLAEQLPNEKKDKVIGLLNIGMNTIALVVLDNFNLLYTHDQTFDGESLVDSIQEKLNIPDLLLSAAPLEPPTEPLASDINAITKSHLAPHLRYFLQYFYSSHQQKEVQHLFLAGDCTTIPGIAECIQQETNLATSLANPFLTMMKANSIDEHALQHIAPAFVLCCGLAMHRIYS